MNFLVHCILGVSVGEDLVHCILGTAVGEVLCTVC